MITILKAQTDRDQIPRYLFGPDWEKVQVANKTGSPDQARKDIGIVFTPNGDFVLSLFAQQAEDRRWTADNEASTTLGKLAQVLLRSFREKR